MTPDEAKNLSAMKGGLVEISWRNPDDDWPYFRLLEVSEKDSTIKLRGTACSLSTMPAGRR